MSETLSRALVLTILRHAEDFPWRVQDIGLVSLRFLTTSARTDSTSGTRATTSGTPHPRPSVRLHLDNHRR